MKKLLTLMAILSMNSSAFATTIVTSKHIIEREDKGHLKKNQMILPYLFSTDSMGFNAGVGTVMQGVGQEQLTIGGTVYGGGSDSYGLGLGVWNYQVPYVERLFFSIDGMYAYYPNQKAYGGGAFEPTDSSQPLPGSSNSSNDQYIEGKGYSNWFNVKLEYLLPIGDRKNNVIERYKMSDGLLVNQSTESQWNPLENGTTTVVFRQFNRYQSFKDDDGKISGNLHAVELGIQYDNTDFTSNPSVGSRQFFSFSRDGQIFDSETNWNFLQLDTSKYLSLGESDWASQRILAFNFWTGYSPTWDLKSYSDDQVIVTNGPPYNEGATLGGWERMRGYDMYRFHDKASIYFGAEYRYTLKYNPIEDVSWLKFLNLDWFQLVGFLELGEVASEYDIKDLTSNMKFDGGVSLRAFAGGIVVRSDLGISNEGANIWFMVNQPF
ncbi:BamA/TamA family outer membrane protein [Vibrio sp. SS-MA-C1-2]|uniref:BamA/TamA family outer membrane protein n=1 Tax=Vibrio sp. SS-MA-C1-2 TaxID=2908646 RepID=UPI001F3DE641|nr:BamA/TamA family outer membrane protein [Vibrio sp. SS-MA-C1-2]UJF18293.1 BamA/TamA family outer membrane protein [Vibrio sp. SS-MA-C1-2]